MIQTTQMVYLWVLKKHPCLGVLIGIKQKYLKYDKASNSVKKTKKGKIWKINFLKVNKKCLQEIQNN